MPACDDLAEDAGSADQGTLTVTGLLTRRRRPSSGRRSSSCRLRCGTSNVPLRGRSVRGRRTRRPDGRAARSSSSSRAARGLAAGRRSPGGFAQHAVEDARRALARRRSSVRTTSLPADGRLQPMPALDGNGDLVEDRAPGRPCSCVAARPRPRAGRGRSGRPRRARSAAGDPRRGRGEALRDRSARSAARARARRRPAGQAAGRRHQQTEERAAVDRRPESRALDDEVGHEPGREQRRRSRHDRRATAISPANGSHCEQPQRSRRTRASPSRLLCQCGQSRSTYLRYGVEHRGRRA